MTKWLFRLLVLPAVFVLTIFEWVGTYILNLSGMICRLITGLTAILAVAVYWIGVASIEQAVNTQTKWALVHLPSMATITIVICKIKRREDL